MPPSPASLTQSYAQVDTKDEMECVPGTVCFTPLSRTTQLCHGR